MKIGYKRVSSVDQNTDRQLEGIALDKTFIDMASGKDTNRHQLQIMLEHVIGQGDEVHVHSLDRLGRNLIDLKSLINQINDKGASVHFHKENLVFNPSANSAVGELMLNILGAFAEFERSLINERQREGIVIAKSKGKHLGRHQSLDKTTIEQIKVKAAAGQSKLSLAREYGISSPTLYKYLKQTD